MNLNTILEIVSVIFGILYLILMIRENIWCWIFGIFASAITVYLYVHVTLYLEAGLNIYYILVGFYGWTYWYQQQNKEAISGKKNVPIRTWKLSNHITTLISCGILSMILGMIMHQYTNSERPYIDAAITVFSFVATYMEARKVLSTWHYWFLLNTAAIFLQIDRGLYFFAILSLFYTIMCV